MGGKTAAIMQPTYLPWLGYFDMIDRVDTFIFLDSVQFSPRSWQQRNRVKSPDGPLWLTVPVQSRGDLSTSIRQTPIAERPEFPADHLKTLHHFYTKCPYFDDYYPQLEKLLTASHKHLGPLNVELITWLSDELGIETTLRQSSELGVDGGKVKRLVNICEAVGADAYLSAPGSRDYILEDNQFEAYGLDVMFHAYEHPEYQQRFGTFESHLAVIDLLFNQGGESLEIIRSGRVTC